MTSLTLTISFIYTLLINFHKKLEKVKCCMWNEVLIAFVWCPFGQVVSFTSIHVRSDL